MAAARVSTPEIRTSPQNTVPQCVTPQRLMAFLKKRNSRLDPRFNTIADWYKHHGETWRVRWDYAFFQMAIETNFLTYKQGNGRWGDVDPRQNNFAGLGTTGGGVAGDKYPDVQTGVLAQIQHLVVYSGERIPEPVGSRTKLKQDVILEVTAREGHPMKFADLSGRWAVDKRYGSSIEWIAKNYRNAYCSGETTKKNAEEKKVQTAVVPPMPVAARPHAWAPAEVKPAITAVAAAPSNRIARQAGPASACKVLTASYGGTKTLLLRSRAGNELRYTALTVLDGFERSMFESYVKAYAPGGSSLGTFKTKDAALARARELCATQARAPQSANPNAG